MSWHLFLPHFVSLRPQRSSPSPLLSFVGVEPLSALCRNDWHTGGACRLQEVHRSNAASEIKADTTARVGYCRERTYRFPCNCNILYLSVQRSLERRLQLPLWVLPLPVFCDICISQLCSYSAREALVMLSCISCTVKP